MGVVNAAAMIGMPAAMIALSSTEDSSCLQLCVCRLTMFGCSRLSYGPIELSGESFSASIDVTFSATHHSSAVEVLLNDQPGGTFAGNGTAAVSMPPGVQSTVKLTVTAESGISSTYDLTVIRPLPSCTDTELTAWCLPTFSTFCLNLYLQLF